MRPRPLGLALNPSARISILEPGPCPEFLVEAPIKGASWSSTRVRAEELPGAHAFLRAILIDGRKDAQIGETDADELRRIGLFVTADAVPELVAYRFPIREPVPSDTLPSLDGAAVRAGRSAHLPPLRIPDEWGEHALHFEPHHHGSVWAPVLVAGAVRPAAKDALASAERRPSGMELDDAATRAQFEREGFAALDNLLPADQVKELARYFQSLAAQGFLTQHDDRGTRRHVAHNHPVARFWHEQLNERVSQLAGRPTKPSYSFVSLYLAGGDLFWHTDRPPCEYTITLLLDYAPLDTHGRSPWALRVKGRDGTTHALYQGIGEGLILKGRERMHGRDVLPEGHRSASLLFHFVNEDYAGVME